ncbi:hypothetical protein [Nocardia salmonicida]|uniref:hypothetical protein n=1 Tax=Nocardia salmonicida TaxID=53431 RepID=UPI002E2ABDD1|nr:hypothetical protein [Nocardia salmonicida]
MHSWVPQRAILERADAFVTHVGMGASTPRKPPPTTSLNDLIGDPEVARRSAQLRTRAQAEGGTIRAADLIENMLV